MRRVCAKSGARLLPVPTRTSAPDESVPAPLPSVPQSTTEVDVKELRVVIDDAPENVKSATDEEILEVVFESIKGGMKSGRIYDPINNCTRGSYLFV